MQEQYSWEICSRFVKLIEQKKQQYRLNLEILKFILFMTCLHIQGTKVWNISLFVLNSQKSLNF